MTIKITSTRNYGANGSKVLVHSPAGVGKTVLCATAPDSIIISAESGLLSLADVDLPVIEVNTVEDVNDVYQWSKSSIEAKQYATLCLDSVTEIAEALLTEFKGQFTDARQAYGKLNDEMSKMIRAFRDLKGKNVYFTAKQAQISDDVGLSIYKPSMPGKTLLKDLPYFFDIVMALKIGQLEDGTTYRYLQTQPDLQYYCKDRSGKLNYVEEPNLAKIFEKIQTTSLSGSIPERVLEIPPDEDEVPDEAQTILETAAENITASSNEGQTAVDDFFKKQWH